MRTFEQSTALIDQIIGQHQFGIAEPVEMQTDRHRLALGAVDGDQHLVVCRQLQNQIAVQRLGKARIGDGRRQAERFEFLGSRQAFTHSGPERQKGDFRAFLDNAALADLPRPISPLINHPRHICIISTVGRL